MTLQAKVKELEKKKESLEKKIILIDSSDFVGKEVFEFKQEINSLEKQSKLNLSVNELFKCTNNKLKYINDDINHSQLEEILNSSFDFVQNAIRIICINHNIKREESFNRHISKMKDRGVIE